MGSILTFLNDCSCNMVLDQSNIRHRFLRVGRIKNVLEPEEPKSTIMSRDVCFVSKLGYQIGYRCGSPAWELQHLSEQDEK